MRGRASCVPNSTQHGQHRHVMPARCTDPVPGPDMDVAVVPLSPMRRGIPCRSSRRHSRCGARASCHSAQLVHLNTHQSSLPEDPQDVATSGSTAQLASLSPWWSHSNNSTTTITTQPEASTQGSLINNQELHPLEPHLPLQPALHAGADSQHSQAAHDELQEHSQGEALQSPRLQPEQEQVARMLTNRLRDCTSWQQLMSVLHTYARHRGSLPHAMLQELQSSGGMADPFYLLQPLNHRHLVVLWYALARIVNLGDEEHVGVFRARGSHSTSTAQQQQQPASDALQQPDSLQQADEHAAVLDDVPISRHRSGPLNRVEVVALRRLVAKLEQASLACMASGTWLATDAVSAMWAMSQVGHRPTNRWLPTWVAFTYDSIPQLGPRHFANALWGLASGGLCPGAAWLQRACQHAVHLAAQHKFTAPAYATVLWAIVRLVTNTQQPCDHVTAHDGSHDTSVLSSSQLLAYLTYTLQHVPDMEPHHISIMLWSLGTLAAGRQPCMQPLACTWSTGNRDASSHSSGDGNGSNVQGPVATANNQQQQQQQLLSTHMAHVNTWRPDPRQQQAASSWEAALHLPGTTQPPAPPTSPTESTQLLYCVDCLWHAAMHWGAQCLGPQGTANALWAAAHLYGPLRPHSNPASASCTPTARAAVHRLVDSSLAVLPHMSAQQLYNSTWALATMQVAPSQAWLSSLMSSSRAKLGQAELQSLTGLLWSLCRLRVKPGAAWMAALMRAVEAQHTSLCPTSLPIFLWSLSYLGYQPGLVWIKSLTSRTVDLLPRMTPQGRAIAVHALAKLRLPAHPAWNAKLQSCLKHSIHHTLAALSPQPSGAASRRSGGRGAAVGEGQQQQQEDDEEGGSAAGGGRGGGSSQCIAPAEMSASLQGLARLGMQPSTELLVASEQLLHSWLTQDQSGGQQSGGQQSGGQQSGGQPLQLRHLAGCLYGLVRLGHKVNEPFMHTATTAVIHVSQHVLSRECEPERRRHLAVDATQACWSLAMMGHTPSQAQLAQLAQITQQLLPCMMHVELAQCTWALQRLGLTSPDPAWISTLLAVFEPQLQQLSRGAHSAAAQLEPHAQQQPDAVPMLLPLSGSPLLSVATILRALVMWGCTCQDVSGPRGSPGRVHISSRWLEAASVVVHVEAARRVATCEGLLPDADALTAGPVGVYGSPSTAAQQAYDVSNRAVMDAARPQSQLQQQQHSQAAASHDANRVAPSVSGSESDSNANTGSSLSSGSASDSDAGPSHGNGLLTSAARLQRPARASTSPGPTPPPPQQRGEAAIAAASVPPPPLPGGLLWCTGPAPYAQDQARLSALSAAEVQISRKTARRRLWHVHRMHVLQHAKVVQASLRALRYLSGQHMTIGGGGSGGSMPGVTTASRDGCEEPVQGTNHGAASTSGSGISTAQSVTPGVGGSTAHPSGSSTSSHDGAHEQYQQYDGLYAEQDLRFIPW